MCQGEYGSHMTSCDEGAMFHLKTTLFMVFYVTKLIN